MAIIQFSGFKFLFAVYPLKDTWAVGHKIACAKSGYLGEKKLQIDLEGFQISLNFVSILQSNYYVLINIPVDGKFICVYLQNPSEI